MNDKSGFAFPSWPDPTYWSAGMTLRDYFAGQALAECIRVASDQTPDNGLLSEVFGKGVNYAYIVADTMLKARAA